MTANKYYSKEQKEMAHETDLVDLLKKNGEELKKVGNEYSWKSGEPSITIRGNLWYNHYEQIGGDTISFVMKYYGKSYAEALEFILKSEPHRMIFNSPSHSQLYDFKMPPINRNNIRAKRYLRYNRKIASDVIDAFIKRHLIYQSNYQYNNKEYIHVVFAGYGKNNKMYHAHERSASANNDFRRNAIGSKPDFSFHWEETDNTIYLFEAPIDLLSYISLHKEGWQKHSYAAACGVSDKVLFKCLKDNPQLNKVFLCLDNDEAGINATDRIAKKLDILHVDYEVLVPFKKDWNEDLVSGFKENLCLR